MLRALGSKEEKRRRRRERREAKKAGYEEYLRSSTWKQIRARALLRDKRICRACGKPAAVVHHVRYPKKLGEERIEWLLSLCVSCHDEIHRLARTMALRRATNVVLGTSSLPKPKKPKKPKQRRLSSASPQHVKDDRTKKQRLIEENERLHAVQQRNRERRESA